jgi:hypothetical protein
MGRIVMVVIGALLFLAGVVWTLQGLDIMGGSGMSGHAIWAVIGPIVAIVGAVLVLRTLRTSPARNDV